MWNSSKRHFWTNQNITAALFMIIVIVVILSNQNLGFALFVILTSILAFDDSTVFHLKKSSSKQSLISFLIFYPLGLSLILSGVIKLINTVMPLSIRLFQLHLSLSFEGLLSLFLIIMITILSMISLNSFGLAKTIFIALLCGFSLVGISCLQLNNEVINLTVFIFWYVMQLSLAIHYIIQLKKREEATHGKFQTNVDV